MEKKQNTWGGKRPGAGRKPVGSTPKRSQIAIRLSVAERAKLEALADAEGRTVADLIRSRVFKREGEKDESG